nr:methyl-accepting chemotaxis protein [Desulfobacula sp.]
MKNGYLEYEWKNPGEGTERAKAVYMVYFEPLDWIISVSTYREEFYHLVDINDFRQNILSHRTGATGYVYVLAEDGTMLAHPRIQGMNLFEQNEHPSDFLKQMLQEKHGKIKYFWKDPGDRNAREKFVIFKHLPEYKWIVASSSYVEEMFAPLKTFRNILIVILIAVVLSSVGITYLISTSVTKPLADLMKKFERGAGGDLSVRMDAGGSDELGRLARHFNSFYGTTGT